MSRLWLVFKIVIHNPFMPISHAFQFADGIMKIERQWEAAGVPKDAKGHWVIEHPGENIVIEQPGGIITVRDVHEQ